MLSLSADPAFATFSVRRVNKATDRLVIREIFRREFYGDYYPVYPDNGLWEIYDRMETKGALGAYLVCRADQVLFLLEIHTPSQLDLPTKRFNDRNAIGFYCFLHSRDETIYLPAFRACIATLLAQSGIHYILTSLNTAFEHDPRSVLLEKSGFKAFHNMSNRLIVYRCTRASFGAKKHRSADILFASPLTFTE